MPESPDPVATEPSDARPLHRVVAALCRGRFSEPWSTLCDFDRRDREQLGPALVSALASRHPLLLIRTPFTPADHAPWLDLAASIIRRENLGGIATVDDPTSWLMTAVAPGTPTPANILPPRTADLAIDPREEPQTHEAIQTAERRLRAWASLEKHAERGLAPSFSRLAGGMRPIVVVLDDYNSFVHRSDDGCHAPLLDKGALAKASMTYGVGSPDEFGRILLSHCTTLNNLAITLSVDAPRLCFPGSQEPDYEGVAKALPFDRFDRMRDRIAAFIVDLEWISTSPDTRHGKEPRGGRWPQLGARAIRLLSRRYPEIACFVYTGQWSPRKLQEGLAHGATWCFAKKESHHAPFLGPDSEQLTCLTLATQMEDGARARMGGFSEAPSPQQLVIEASTDVGAELRDVLKLELPLQSKPYGQALQRLVAGLFPDDVTVRPAAVFSSGRSSAQATFLGALERQGERTASRFIKLCSSFAAQKEHMAYSRVIAPRLNSQVAQVLGPPAVTSSSDGELPLGAVVYSLAGLPEAHTELRSLHHLLEQATRGSADIPTPPDRMRRTLDRVIAPFHGKLGKRSTARPLWMWLGDVLPACFTGELLPLAESLAHDECWRWSAGTSPSRGSARAAEWVHASREAGAARSHRGPMILDGFELLEVESGPRGDNGEGQVTLRHPSLGYRIRLRGRGNEIRRRFGAAWVRPGLPVRLHAQVDETSDKFTDLESRVLQAGCAVSLAMAELSTSAALRSLGARMGLGPLPDPTAVFTGFGSLPLHFTIRAKEGPVHGDLNLQNILFSGKGTTGWLIDFERATERGMPAFDLAKLEVEIWNMHLTPLLEQVVADHPMVVAVVMEAIDSAGAPMADLTSQLVSAGLDAAAAGRWLASASSALNTIARVRDFARRRKIEDGELKWALAAYGLSSIKFLPRKHPWRILLGLAAAARYLRCVLPEIPEDGGHRLLAEVAGGIGTPETRRLRVEGLTLHVQGSGHDIEPLIAAASGGGTGPLAWPQDTERWCVGSTGGITNLLPLMGHLWLRHRFATGERVRSPLIAAEGASCGVIDVLSAGGYPFVTPLRALVGACDRAGGAVAREDMTPVARELMRGRRSVGAMKNASLTTVSLLSKLMASGCTHAVIDARVGRDTKMLSPDQAGEGLQAGFGDALLPESALQVVEAVLGKAGIRQLALRRDAAASHVLQTCSKELAPLKSVRWIATNADVPQCRAIGRELMLFHLDCLITGDGAIGAGGRESLFVTEEGTWADNQYATLHGAVLPALCGVPGTPTPADLQAAWQAFKKDLPALQGLVARRCLHEWLSVPMETPVVRRDLATLATDLEVLTFTSSPYAPDAVAGEGLLVASMDAYFLDGLFEWLCGSQPMDPQVGIWLHRLPGEFVGDVSAQPIVSVFHRPSRTSARGVEERVREFLGEHVRLTPRV